MLKRAPLLFGLVLIATLSQAQSTPTFDKEVVRIFQANCQNCHHTGGIAPFSLMDYASARPWAVDIRDQVSTHTMPPWKPTQGAGVFQGARVMSQADINTVIAWVNAGSPEGNASDLPTPLTFPNGWVLGQPDLVLNMANPAAVYAAGADIYRCYSLKTNLPADTYLNAIQLRPGDPTVVHHVVLFSDTAGQSALLDTGNGYPCFGDPGFTPDYKFFGAWAPGSTPAFLSPGTAMLIPKGGYIAMQVHYHPSGTATSDQTQVGLYFTKAPIDKLVNFSIMVNFLFTIPAGNSHYPVGYTGPAPATSHLTHIFPHQHLLGVESHTQLVSGSTITPLIDIPNWDFNWQGLYQYLTPIPMKSTDTLQFTKYYNNSVTNPNNPNNPPVPVGWGEQTTDEMAVDLIGYTKDSQHLIPPTFTSANIVNAASYAGGSVAPGSIMSLFGLGLGSNWASAAGSVPTTLANTKITVSGVTGSVPLFYASPTQVNFQMPYEASGNITLTLIREDNQTTAVTIPVGAAQPGLFSMNSSGAGPAAAQRADTSTLTSANPAKRGEVVVLYATGLGKLNANVATGQAASQAAVASNAVTVTIGGRTVTPDYAGITPGFVGLYQVNFHIPADLATTGDVPVTIASAGVVSNTVTIAIQ